MYVKTITYTDFDDVERTDKLYFNLTKAELTELQLTTEGGLENHIKKIIQSKDTAEIIKTFKNIITMSYGEKSDDGKHFMKSHDIVEAFTHTQAYSDLFMELATDEKAATEFLKGIMPKDIANEIEHKTTEELLAEVNK